MQFDWMIFAYAPWDSWRGRPHHFAELLSRTDRVAYVDPPLSVLRTRRLSTTITNVADSIYRIQPSVGLPGSHLDAIHGLNHRRWSRQLERARLSLGLGRERPLAGIVQLPIWDRCPSSVQADVWIYDCVDAFREIPPNRPAHIDRCESRLLLGVHTAVAVSQPLLKALADQGVTTELLPNACDPDHFERAVDKNPDPTMASLPQPRLLYVGGIDRCVDIGALEKAAEFFQEGSVVLVGPTDRQVGLGNLLNRQNVHSLGRQPYDRIPSIMAAADTCLLPFRRIRWGICRDNIKLYEYLASGVPIATTDLPRARDFGGLVEIAAETDGPQGFAHACQRASQDRSPDRALARRAAAKEHTWSNRVDKLRAVALGAWELRNNSDRNAD